MKILRMIFTCLLLSAFCLIGPAACGESKEQKQAREGAEAISAYLCEYPPNTESAQKIYDGLRDLPRGEATDEFLARAAAALVELYSNRAYLTREGERHANPETPDKIYSGLPQLSSSPKVDEARARAAVAVLEYCYFWGLDDMGQWFPMVMKAYDDLWRLAKTEEVDALRARAIGDLTGVFWTNFFLPFRRDEAKIFLARLEGDLDGLGDSRMVAGWKAQALFALMMIHLHEPSLKDVDKAYAVREKMEKLPQDAETRTSRFLAALRLAWDASDEPNREELKKLLLESSEGLELLAAPCESVDMGFGRLLLALDMFDICRVVLDDEAKAGETARISAALFKTLAEQAKTNSERGYLIFWASLLVEAYSEYDCLEPARQIFEVVKGMPDGLWPQNEGLASKEELADMVK